MPIVTSENCTNDTIINRPVRITRLHHTDHIALIKSNCTVEIKLHHKIQTVLNVPNSYNLHIKNFAGFGFDSR